MNAAILVFAVIGIIATAVVLIFSAEWLICRIERREEKEHFIDVGKKGASITGTIKPRNDDYSESFKPWGKE